MLGLITCNPNTRRRTARNAPRRRTARGAQKKARGKRVTIELVPYRTFFFALRGKRFGLTEASRLIHYPTKHALSFGYTIKYDVDIVDCGNVHWIKRTTVFLKATIE